MKFFRRLATGIDVLSLLAEIDAQPGAWLVNTSRQDRIAVQRQTASVILRGIRHRQDLLPNENQECVQTKVSRHFPLAIAFMRGVAQQFQSDLSRASIVRLAPRSRVGRHIDEGSYYLIRNRLHLVLQSPHGSIVSSADEQVRMHVGELWWLDNKQHHSAENPSEDWRIHYIFDLLPFSHRVLAKNPLPPGE